MKLTPWYPNTINPVRKGLYEVRIPKGVHLWSFWTGERWNYAEISVQRAVTINKRSMLMYNMPMQWRGVAK